MKRFFSALTTVCAVGGTYLILFAAWFGLLAALPMENKAQAQDESVAATNSRMYAAMHKISYSSENTTGVGPIDSSKPLMTINIHNDSDEPLTIKTFSVTFHVYGDITAWPTLDGAPMIYRMQFNTTGPTTITFPMPPGYSVIEPHTTARLDLYAVIPNAQKGTTACATTFTMVDYMLGPWMGCNMPDVACRSWKVE